MRSSRVSDSAGPRRAVFHPASQDEYDEILAYLGAEAPAVVEAFREEMIRTVAFIEEHPEAASVERGGVRCKLLRRFPYELYYVVERHLLRVLAVAHQKRRPGYWMDRLKS